VNRATIASLTTAAGTRVLAVATFGATRSANRASSIAERSLQAALRPVLVHAQLGDPRQKIGFADQHWVHVEGPGAVFEELDGVIYLAFGLRNAGSGIAVLTAWHPTPERVTGGVPHVSGLRRRGSGSEPGHDMDGGQQAITRLTLLPGHGDGWVAAVGRQWMLDGQVTGGRWRARDAAARR
jgi:hypothetical protein